MKESTKSAIAMKIVIGVFGMIAALSTNAENLGTYEGLVWGTFALVLGIGVILTFPLCCFDQISCWHPRNTS